MRGFGYWISRAGWRGPLAAMYLSDQGAEVIKVEPPDGDPTREWNGSPVWNRGKQSLTLNLKTPQGAEVLKRLAGDAAILIETNKPGTMQQLGLDYETLHTINPQLIYCSITAYPRKSKDAQRAGYDALVQARTGIQWGTAELSARSGRPILGERTGVSVYTAAIVRGEVSGPDRDQGGGCSPVARQGRGSGSRHPLAQGVLMWTTMFRMKADQYPANFTTVSKSMRGTVYECADGQWVHLMTLADSEQQIDKILDIPADLAMPPGDVRLLGGVSPEFLAQRQAALRQAFRTKYARDVFLEKAHAVNIPVVPIQRTYDGYRHPQLLHNKMVIEVDDPEYGRIRQMGIPYTLTKNPSQVQGPQPRVGQHTDAILQRFGYDAAAITQLRTAGVV